MIKLARIAACVVALAFGSAAFGQSTYPNRPVTLVVPYPAGSTDTFARLLARRLGPLWNQQVLVDNKPGGSGVIGMMVGRNAVPDGYTLLLGLSGPLAANPHLLAKLPYDPLTDFTIISKLLIIPLMLAAHPSAPFSSVKELIEAARKTPGQIQYASPGNGTGSHLAAEMFKVAAGIDLAHVPYKGTAPAVTDTLGGHVKLVVTGFSDLAPHVRAGKLKGIAVTAKARSNQLPDVPAVAESYPGFEAVGWGGLLGPRGLPPEVVAKLNSDLRNVVADPTFMAAAVEVGMIADYQDGAEFRKYIQSELEAVGRVVKEAKIRAD